MLGKRKKTIMVLAIITGSLAVICTILWIFFPVILRALFPTWYTHYSLVRTNKILSAEVSVINDFFDFPDLSDSYTKHLAVDLSNMSAGLSYDKWDIAAIDLTKLNIGIDLLHDREEKQASLDLNAGWDGIDFPLTLFTDIDRVALGFDDKISWVANAKTFGKELAGLGLPVDEDMELDLGFLFPDVISEEAREESGNLAKSFFNSLKFKRCKDADNLAGYTGTAMTAVVDGQEFQAFLYDLIDCRYGQSDRGNQLKQRIDQMHAEQHELTLFINEMHHAQAVQADISTGFDSKVSALIQLAGEQNMLDNIIIDVSIQNSYGGDLYHINSSGLHVPTDGLFTSTTVISGFDNGTMHLYIETDNSGALFISTRTDSFTILATGQLGTTEDTINIMLNTVDLSASLGSIRLTGDLGLSYGNTTSHVHDITYNAYSISDFDFRQLRLLFQIIWDIIRQDRDLMEMFGQQFFSYVMSTMFGDRTGAAIMDILGDDIGDYLDLFDRLISSESGDVKTLLGIILDSPFGNKLKDQLSDQRSNILDGILEGVLGENRSEEIADLLDKIIGDNIPPLLSDLLESVLDTG